MLWCVNGCLSAAKGSLKVDKTHYQECVLDMLSEMFGEDCIGKLVKSDRVQITVNGMEASLNISNGVSLCADSWTGQPVSPIRKASASCHSIKNLSAKGNKTE